MQATFTAVADHAVLVEFGTVIDEATGAQVLALDRAINAQPPAGVIETVPAFVNLLVVFDPLQTDAELLTSSLRESLAKASVQETAGREHVVTVCYDDDFGPDLDDVAKQCACTSADVVEQHLSGVYRVGMYGFAPGYAYLSGTPEKIQVPRKKAALRGIASGSVIIAGPQCLVSTITMPTGWSIIGRSPVDILRDDDERPFLFDVGDSVRFERIDREEYNRLDQARSKPVGST